MKSLHLKRQFLETENDKIGLNELLFKVKKRIIQRLSQLDNLALYPIHMGPHQVYTIDHPLEAPDTIMLRDLLDTLSTKYIQRDIIEQKSQQKDDVDQNAQNAIKTRKYKKYSKDFKVDVVKLVRKQIKSSREKSISFHIAKVAEEIGTAPKNIFRWMSLEDLSERESGRKPKFPELENRLYAYICENPQAKRRSVIEYARQIMADIEGEEDFKFSKGWFERFRNRYKICKKNKGEGRRLMRKRENFGCRSMEVSEEESDNSS